MSDNVSNYFSEYGYKMHTLAILAILSLIFRILSIIFFNDYFILFQLIFIIMLLITFFVTYSALGHIKEAGNALNDQKLFEYCSKLIIGLIIEIIDSFIILYLYYLWKIHQVQLIILGIFILVVVILLHVIAALLRYMAWNRLYLFFRKTKTTIPFNIRERAIYGSRYMRSAELCMIFAGLIVTVIIAAILRIIGYYKLNTLKLLASSQSDIEESKSL